METYAALSPMVNEPSGELAKLLTVENPSSHTIEAVSVNARDYPQPDQLIACSLARKNKSVPRSRDLCQAIADDAKANGQYSPLDAPGITCVAIARLGLMICTMLRRTALRSPGQR